MPPTPLLFICLGRQRSVTTLASARLSQVRKTYRLHHNTGDLIRVSVRRRATILKVTIALVAALARDTDGAATVGNTVGELVDAAGLVTAGQTHGVVLAVHGDMLLVAALELLDRGLDVLHATGLAHRLAGEVAVQTSSVPVAGDGLGVERDLGTELLGDAVEEETCAPEVVTHWISISGESLQI